MADGGQVRRLQAGVAGRAGRWRERSDQGFGDGADQAGGDQVDLGDAEFAGAHALFEQVDEQLGIGFAEQQALLVHLRLHRLGDQREGQASAVPGASGELLQAGGQTGGRAAGPTQDLGEGIDLHPAGIAEDLGGQLTLAAEMAIQAAGGDAGVFGQGLHGQAGEATFGDADMGAGEDVLALFLSAIEAGGGDAIDHELNPCS